MFVIAIGVLYAMWVLATDETVKILKIQLKESRPLQLPLSDLKEIQPIRFRGGCFTRLPQGWSIAKKEVSTTNKKIRFVLLVNKKSPEDVRLTIMNSNFMAYDARHTEEEAAIDIGLTFPHAEEALFNAKQFMARYPDIRSLFEAIRVLTPSRPNRASDRIPVPKWDRIDIENMEAAYQSVLAQRATGFFGQVIPTGIRVGKVSAYMSADILGDRSLVRVYVCSDNRKSHAVVMMVQYEENDKGTSSENGLILLERLATGLVAGIKTAGGNEEERGSEDKVKGVNRDSGPVAPLLTTGSTEH